MGAINDKIIDYHEVQRWLSDKKERSRVQYLIAIRFFCTFTGLTPEQLIDEYEEDRKKPLRKQGAPEARLTAFYEHLLKNHRVVQGMGRKETNKVGVSRKLATLRFAAIRSFYRANGAILNIKTPRATPKKENFRMDLRLEDVKKLLECTTCLRDRAIVLTMFQSGMDVSTLCSLNYGDVERELNDGRMPLMLHIIREKEGIEYHTFLGRDAVEALKLYIAEGKRYAEQLCVKCGEEKPKRDCNTCNKPWKPSTPLFLLEGKAKYTFKRIKTNLVQDMFRELAIKSGLVSKEQMEFSDINPAGPHSLRKAFSNILKAEGVNEIYIEYMMGHALPLGGAYSRPKPDELRDIYGKREPALSPSRASVKELKMEVGDQQVRIRELEGELAKYKVVLEKLNDPEILSALDTILKAATSKA